LRELKECWKSTVARQGTRTLCVDLTGVTFIDPAGEACLAALHSQGARFVATDCVTKAIVDEIDQAASPDAGRRIINREGGPKRNPGAT
jgi:anti-anti-sigma regulatory factor